MIPLLLFLASFILRLFYLNAGLFHYDGVLLAQQIEEGTVFSNDFLRQRIGYVTIIYLLTEILSIEKTILLINAFFGAASIVVLYFLAKQLFNKREAIYASILFSVSPLFLSITTYAKEHGAEVFFLLLSLLLIIRSKYILAGLVSSFFILIKETAVLFIPLLIAALFLNKKPTAKEFFTWFMPLLISTILYIAIALSSDILNPGHPAQDFLGIFSSKFIEAVQAFGISITVYSIPFLFLGIWVLHRKKSYKTVLFLLFWLSWILFFGNHRLFSPRWLSPLLPSAYMLIGVGISRIKKINIAIFITLIIASLTFAHPLLSYRHNNGGIKTFALELNKTKDSHILIYGDQCIFIKYYSKRNCSPNDPSVKTIALIQSIIEQNKSIFLIEHFEKKYSEETHINPFLKHLREKYKVKDIREIEFEDFHKAELGSRIIKAKLIEITSKN